MKTQKILNSASALPMGSISPGQPKIGKRHTRAKMTVSGEDGTGEARLGGFRNQVRPAFDKALGSGLETL